MPTPSYVGTALGADVTVGAGSAETGILLSDLSYDLENPQVDFFSRFGSVVGYATNHAAALNYSLSGQVSDKDAGVNVLTFTASVELANKEFFASANSEYNALNFAAADSRLVSVSGSQPQGGARTGDINLNIPLGLFIR